jgi:large subunit ribosomal protein L25
MTAALSIQAELREQSGKGIARSLRRNEKIPAVMYARHKPSVLLALNAKDVEVLRSNPSATLIELDVEGKKYKAVPKHISLHPVTDLIEHIEMVELIDGCKVSIPIKIEGASRSQALKRHGVINFATRNLKCLIRGDSVPRYISIDIANLNMGQVVCLKDINLPEGVESVDCNPNHVILKISGKRSGVKEENEASATTATAEGDAAAKAAPGKTAEPAKAKK